MLLVIRTVKSNYVAYLKDCIYNHISYKYNVTDGGNVYKENDHGYFAIVMALMLITASSYASSVSAEKVGHKGKRGSIDHASTPTSSTTSKKNLKSLSDCESKAAKNGGLTQAQVDDCYNQLFPREKVSQTLRSTPTQGHQSTHSRTTVMTKHYSQFQRKDNSQPQRMDNSNSNQGQQSIPTQGQQSISADQNYSQPHALDQTLIQSNARTTNICTRAPNRLSV